MISKKNLILLGMMGAGKTTIGKLVAKKLNLDFYDIDQIIEKENNMKINDIFQKKGETFFRKQEEYTTINYLKKKHSIISLGGGAFINKNIRNNVLSNAKSFWLTTSVGILKSRIKFSKKRPIINQIGLDEIEDLIKKRKEFYSLADYKIECRKLTINQISDKIIELYENSQN
jgi:shikimate kinase/shikimate kinase/3-dehydroquinate synthase|tara:strand:+ start:197 stop:715 length:519 start_codon:yes stop_codon:yes gene_type:complete